MESKRYTVQEIRDAVHSWVLEDTNSFVSEESLNDLENIHLQHDGYIKKDGAELISDERKRQIDIEGFTPEHDNGYQCGELSDAAICYAARGYWRTRPYTILNIDCIWPFGIEWWKPKTDNSIDQRIKELVKAGALIAAEIDRLQRLD